MEIFSKYDDKKEEDIFREYVKEKERVSSSGKVIFDWNRALEGLGDKIRKIFLAQEIEEVYKRMNEILKIC